jgi:hypothetical protein
MADSAGALKLEETYSVISVASRFLTAGGPALFGTAGALARLKAASSHNDQLNPEGIANGHSTKAGEGARGPSKAVRIVTITLNTEALT